MLCYVADYAQNMCLPNFASEQPGATYYYSPFNVYVFGVVDASIDSLTAYMYPEDIGKKGGNNVASLLMRHLHRTSIATTAEPFKEINFVMDNCSGQNKNRHVLRLLHLLVKRKVATTARAIFLVRGHTKNDCDRLFNTMKKVYRKSNCFTPNDIVECMVHPKVEPVMVAAGDFADWDKLEDEYIKAPTGETKTNHIFLVDINRNNGNSMYLQESDGSVETELVLVRPQYQNQDDATFWKELQPLVIPALGIQDIKWRELYKKWGAFVPEDKEQQWRYYNEAPPEEKMKTAATHTKESSHQRKKRSRTVHDNDAKPLQSAKEEHDTKELDATTGVI